MHRFGAYFLNIFTLCGGPIFFPGTASGFALHVPLYTIGLQPSRRREKSSVFHGFDFSEMQIQKYLSVSYIYIVGMRKIN